MNASRGPARVLRDRVPTFGPEFARVVQRTRLTVVPRRRIRAPRMPFVTLVSAVLLGGVVGLLMFNTQMQQASFAAKELEEQAHNLGAREQTLRNDLQELRNPQRIALAAVEQGLVIPGGSCTVDLAERRVSGSCVPATSDSTPPLEGPAPRKPPALSPPDRVVVAGGQAAPGRHGTTRPGRDVAGSGARTR
ncbi:hypothetical protein [Nocardioides sp. SYSU D00038]|uniref:hypothetical protein n=1 Tax=Nocardioides sp. SYSU D00038 TaxID=2812554 RepID=UPI0019686A62|nr:hypothetical protein [Nocardioides sp. SYSU D00038]